MHTNNRMHIMHAICHTRAKNRTSHNTQIRTRLLATGIEPALLRCHSVHAHRSTSRGGERHAIRFQQCSVRTAMQVVLAERGHRRETSVLDSPSKANGGSDSGERKRKEASLFVSPLLSPPNKPM